MPHHVRDVPQKVATSPYDSCWRSPKSELKVMLASTATQDSGFLSE